MIKTRMGDIFKGFDDAEIIELEESEEEDNVDKERKLNDYKQNQVEI